MTLAASAFAWILAIVPPAAAPPSAKPPDPPVPAVPPSTAPASDLPRMLVFTRTLGFRHKSIPIGVQTVREVGADIFVVDTTEDAALFTPDNLKKYRAVVFLNTTGDVLNDMQQAAFESFIRAGGGFVGVHAAADTEYDWPWYGKLMGAYFKGHPDPQQATIKVEDRAHRSTSHLPESWNRFDEWYSFRTNPRTQTHVLASLLETSYKAGDLAMGDHPIAWCHEFDGGRAWYTALGHVEAAYKEPHFRQHLREGISWAAHLPELKLPAVPDEPRKQPDAKDPAAPTAPMPPVKPAPGTPQGSPNSSPPPSPPNLILASAPPLLAAFPTSVMLAVVMVVMVIVLGAMGQGIRAPFLAWLCPGLGHLSLGYRKRAFLGMVGVLGMFVTGVLVGGADAVDSREDAAWFIAQAGNGPMAFGVDVFNQNMLKTGAVGELIAAPAPAGPNGRPIAKEILISSYKGLGPANEFGTLFIALGGLMNLILVMDCARRDPAHGPSE